MADLPALLPERHSEGDFFIADIFDAIPLKNDRHTMEHPFFTLSTKMDLRSIRYEKDGVKIIISPSLEYGLPTMYDKDILLYCGSLIMAEINKGQRPPKTLRFSAHDLMITTNRDTSGEAYKMLRNAFERLAGCLITTNIKTNNRYISSGFHILESYRIVKESHDKSRMVEVEITVSNWFYNALIGKEVLTLNRNYFRLRKPIERRLYELARKHCGKQDFWEIRLDNLKDKVGSSTELRKFRSQIRQIIEIDLKQNHFPDYKFTLNDNDLVCFSHKNNSMIQQLEFHEKSFSLPLAEIDKEKMLDDISLSSQQNVMKICRDYNYDFSHLISEFKSFILKKGMPKNISGAFLNFARKKFNL